MVLYILKKGKSIIDEIITTKGVNINYKDEDYCPTYLEEKIRKIRNDNLNLTK